MLASVCNKEKFEQILAYMLDENEFFGPYGIRSLSRYHLEHPFVFDLGWAGIQGAVSALQSRTPECSVATPTGEGQCGCR